MEQFSHETRTEYWILRGVAEASRDIHPLSIKKGDPVRITLCELIGLPPAWVITPDTQNIANAVRFYDVQSAFAAIPDEPGLATINPREIGAVLVMVNTQVLTTISRSVPYMVRNDEDARTV